MRSMFLALAMWPSAVLAINCPIGSFPSIDQWGNQVCRPIGGGAPNAAQGTLDNCPIGSFPSIDTYGNRVCKTFSSPQQPSREYYDTSQGCPIGTFTSIDNFGNSVCKGF